MNEDEQKKMVLEYLDLGLQNLEGANGDSEARRIEIEKILGLTQEEILEKAKELLR